LLPLDGVDLTHGDGEFENGFMMLPEPAAARGRPRFMTRFLPTQASATTRLSTSRLWLFSALAMADCRHFLTSPRAALEKVRSASASHLLAPDHGGTRLSFCGLGAQHLVLACASLSATRRGFFS
jgi:hypothetical protein